MSEAPLHSSVDAKVDRPLAERPRVLVVAPEPFYEDRGTPIALLHVLNSFGQHGCRIDLLTYPLGDSPDIRHVRYIRAANPFRIGHVRIGLSLRKLLLDASLFFKLCRTLKHHDYAFIHAVEESAFLVSFLIRKRRTAMVYDMQCNMAEQLCEHPYLGFRPLHRLWHACQRWLIRRSSIVACSHGLGEYVQSVSPGKPIHEWCYPNQTIVDDPAAAEALRNELDIAPGQPVVVYTGNFEPYQGLDLLVESMPLVAQRFPDVIFLVVGGDQPGMARLGKQLSALLPAANYRLLPRQPQSRISACLDIADVLVSPRRYGDNLPLKVIEYLASSRPIVATDIKAHRSILSEDTAILTEPDAEAFSAGIIRLLDSPALRQSYAERGMAYYRDHLDWNHFHHTTGRLIAQALAHPRHVPGATSPTQVPRANIHEAVSSVSVVIPVRNAATGISRLVDTIFAQRVPGQSLEIIVVNDGSTDDTAEVASAAGARVVNVPESTGNPARARNLGARAAQGDFLIFLDVDCVPEPGWLAALTASRVEGWRCVGGALCMPRGLSLMSRLDYYCGWYHAHEKQPRHHPVQHPPCNLGIDRSLFLETSGFTERQPIAYAHEELGWQSELKQRGIPILFQPTAMAGHHNRKGLGNVLRRSYRWAYSAVESKRGTGVTRMGWLYRFPLLAALLAIPLIPIHAAYITWRWLRVGVWEPLWLSPLVLLVRGAYGLGMCVGTLRWMSLKGDDTERRPRWE